LAAGAFAIDLGNGFTLEGEVKAGFKVETKDDGYVINPDDLYNKAEDPGVVTFPGGTGDATKKADVALKDDSDNTRASLWNEDAGKYFRTRLTLGYDVEQGGAKIRLQTNDSLNDSKIGVEYAYGWAHFLGKKITVSVGKIDGHAWGLGKLHTNAFDPGFDALTGARAEFKLVEGVSFGFALPLDEVSYGSSYDAATSKWTTVKADRTLGALFGGAVIGGLYSTDFIKAAAGLKLSPAINSQDYGIAKSTDLDKYGETPAYVEVIAGVSVKPIDPLVVALDAHIDTRTYTDEKSVFDKKVGYARIGAKGEYTGVPKLTASLKFDLLLQNDKAERGDSAGEQFTQYYKYDKADTTKNVKITKADYARYVSVETYGDPSLGFELGAEYKVAETITAYLKLGSDNLLWIAGDVKYDKDNPIKSTYSPGAGLWVKPGVKITLGAANIDIFDKIDKIGASDLDYVYQDGGDKDGTTSPITNQFQIDFNWKF
jgi:hypothetical protein